VSPAVQALIQPFFCATEPPTTHAWHGECWTQARQALQHLSLHIAATLFVDVARAGIKLQVIQQTDSHYVAVSKGRQLGLIALNLPAGVLLVTFDRSTFPHTALTAVLAACSSPVPCARSSNSIAAFAASSSGLVRAAS
jgi:hypothetical protein